MSRTLTRALADLTHREQIGVERYGITVDRDDFDLERWLRESYDEALDLVLYLRRALDAHVTEKYGPDNRHSDAASAIANQLQIPPHVGSEIHKRIMKSMEE